MKSLLAFVAVCGILLIGMPDTSAAQGYWQATNGPYGSFVYSLALDSTGQIFAGTGGGGIFRASGGGSGWTQLGSGLTYGSIYSIWFL